MADAFQCDRCGNFKKGGVDNVLKVSGLGFISKQELDLCHDCLKEKVEDLPVNP